MSKKNEEKKMKKKSLIFFGIGAGFVILVNFIFSDSFFRIDLTEDKRYTISNATKNLLSKINDEVFVTVYLTGDDLPSGFNRLNKAVKEQLDEFRNYSGGKVEYTFVNPENVNDKNAKGTFLKELKKKGILSINLFEKKNGGQVERTIFPYALISYKGKESSVLLLQNTKFLSAEEKLNQSVENVEYELANAIRKLDFKDKKRIGITYGHGEPADIQLDDLIKNLQEFYMVYRVDISKVNAIDLRKNLDALMIIKPDTLFNEDDKYKIDQFIVKGGKGLFFIDQLKINEISENGTLAIPYNLDLNDLFFRYGIRINNDVLKDLTSARIPMVVGNIDNKPQTQLMPWRYFPVINTFGNHPIVKNTDAIYGKFMSTIDTVKAEGIKKTILFSSSPYSKTVSAPVMIAYDDARRDPDPKTYNKGSKPLAYLLEGKFRSLYANRITKMDNRYNDFKEFDSDSKIIICGDGDVLINNVDKTRKAMPLGYDPFSRQIFGNKDFLVHSIDYMLDANGILSARNKQIVLRPLDKTIIKEQRLKWQLINLILPILGVILFGFGRAIWWKRKFA